MKHLGDRGAAIHLKFQISLIPVAKYVSFSSVTREIATESEASARRTPDRW
jgi:hypothetical protein